MVLTAKTGSFQARSHKGAPVSLRGVAREHLLDAALFDLPYP